MFGRNYFNRPSAPETEDTELVDERVAVLAEVAALKQLAIDYASRGWCHDLRCFLVWPQLL
jgi:hypothetical protein